MVVKFVKIVENVWSVRFVWVVNHPNDLNHPNGTKGDRRAYCRSFRYSR